MASPRRTPVPLLGALGLAALLLASTHALTQDSDSELPDPVQPGGAGQPEADARLPRLLRLLPDYAAKRQWDTLAHALHTLLDAPPGVLLRQAEKGADGKPFVHWVSPHLPVNEVVVKLPPEALKAYERLYGAAGRELLAEAKRANDGRLLARVAQRHLYTGSGVEALALLAEHHLDARRYHTAAFCYDRLLQHPGADLSVRQLYQASLAYRRAGDRAGAERAWKRLEQQARVEGKKVLAQLAQLRMDLDVAAPLPPAAGPARDWLLFGGNVARSGQTAGGKPLLSRPRWQRATLQDRFDPTGEPDRGQEAKDWVDFALQQRRDKPGEPFSPGFFSLASGGLVIYRTYNGITAVNLHEVVENGQVVAKPGEIEWKGTEFDGALAVVGSTPNTRGTLDAWLRQVYFPAGASHLLHENAAVGTLSSDGRLLYAVDELAVPIPPKYLQPAVWKSPQVHDEVKPLVKGNSLHAFELDSGKIVFRLGDRGRTDEFTGGHFLGAPLPLGGNLYALHEKDGALWLLCLEPSKTGAKLLSRVALATVQDHYVSTPLRRTQPSHLAYADGILVCPTHAGAILGVDLATQELVWGYAYRPGKQPPSPPMDGRPAAPPEELRIKPAWNYSAPMIADGKVIFTAPDESSVHCLRLRDGALLWKVPRDDNVYLAGVFDGKVLLVGNSACRALNLADGKPAWRLATNVPSGRGVGGGGLYYLPLRRTGEGDPPGIVAIDVGKGRIVQTFTGKETPGNLLFHGGYLISQGATSITAYPLFKEKRE